MRDRTSESDAGEGVASPRHPGVAAPPDRFPTALGERARAFVQAALANDVLIASLGFLALLAIFFYDVVFLGRTLSTSSFLWGVMGTSPPYGYPAGIPDYNVYIMDPLASAVAAEPTIEKTAALLGNLKIPLWDADMALGRPLLGSLDPGVVSLVRLPVMLFPTPEMWDSFLIGRFFVAALSTYLLCKRLGLAALPSFGAAVAYVFSGYFMLYVNMPHSDYAMMIPVFLFALELMLEKPSPLRVAFVAIALAAGFFADNPEASLLFVAYGLAYYLARALTLARSQPALPLRRSLPPLALAVGAGLGLTAFAVIPFLELTGSLGLGGEATVHRHAPGSDLGVKFTAPRHLISLFMPFFNGPPVDNFQGTGWTGIRTYVGVVVPVLALIGFWNRPAMARFGWVFLALGAIAFAKIYGVPVINSVGHLPVLEVIDFGLYGAPLAAFSIIMLAGIGLDHLVKAQRSWWQLLAAAAIVLLGGWLVWLNRDILDTIPDSHLATQLGFAAAMLVAAAVLVAVAGRGPVSGRAAAAGLVGLVVLELLVFTTPTKGEFLEPAQAVYGVEEIPVIDRPQRYDPFTTPPYVEFLKDDASTYRVLGLNYVLYPNTARVYGIDDVRGFTATTVRRYFRFVQEFINPSVRSRFTGARLAPLGSESEPPLLADNPMLDMLNTKYILTAHGLPEAYDYELTDTYVSAAANPTAVRADVYSIRDEDDIVLFQHPPSSVPHTFVPDQESRYLLFRLAMDPESWDPGKGDGVLFRVLAREEGAEDEVIFSRFVDPKNEPADRRWIEGSVDLEPYLSRPVTLVLSTQPGEDPTFDWAGWGGLRLAPSPDAARVTSDQFRLVYDGEVQIYENLDAYPRAFVVHEAETVTDEDGAIARMHQTEFDPASKAVIEGDLPEDQAAALTGGASDATVEIVASDDDSVKLSVQTDRPGMLVLNDAYYPGWKALIDGKRTRIYPTDLAVRSVFLEAGAHEVEFVYSPTSFKVGLAITLASAAALVLYALLGPLRRAIGRLR